MTNKLSYVLLVLTISSSFYLPIPLLQDRTNTSEDQVLLSTAPTSRRIDKISASTKLLHKFMHGLWPHQIQAKRSGDRMRKRWEGKKSPYCRGRACRNGKARENLSLPGRKDSPIINGQG